MNPPQKKQEFTIEEAFLYMLGAIGIQVISVPFVQFITKFYSPSPDSGNTIYMKLTLATTIMMLGVINDSISDPLIGWWSDRTRSKMGRRRPFIVYGCIPLLISFILVWFPVYKGPSSINFLWGAFWCSVYYWALTVVVIPYFALLPEIGRSDSGRITLAIWQSVGMVVGLLIGFFAGMVLEIVQKSFGLSYDKAYQIVMSIYGVIGVTLLIITGLTVKERYVIDRDSAAENASLADLFKNIFSAFTNKPFLIFVAAIIMFNVGFYAIQLILPYFSHVMLHKGDDYVSYLMLPFFGICMLFYGVIFAIKEKVNKKYMLLFALLFMTLIFPFLGVAGFIKSMDKRIIFSFVLFALAGIPQAVLYVIQGPIVGEIVDLDETITGKRREAIYNGALGFAMKAGYSISAPIIGIIFNNFGYTQDKPFGVMIAGPVTAAFSLIGFIIFLFYPILKIARASSGGQELEMKS